MQESPRNALSRQVQYTTGRGADAPRKLPRSLRRGIEDDKNVALAIVIAAVILGVAHIVAAAIRG